MRDHYCSYKGSKCDYPRAEKDLAKVIIDAAVAFVESRYESGFCCNDLEEMRRKLLSLREAGT